MKRKKISILVICLFTLFIGLTGLSYSETKAALQAEVLSDISSYTLTSENTFRFEQKSSVVVLNEYGRDNFADPRFIYDTRYETIVPEKVETVTSEGKTFHAPQTALNTLTPRVIEKAPYFSFLKELTCSFVSIDYGSNLNLQIVRERGAIPDNQNTIEIVETIGERYPIKHKEFRITVPEQTEVKFAVLRSDIQPEITTDESAKIYSWEFNDIQPYKYESHSPGLVHSYPKLIISTVGNWESIISPIQNSILKVESSDEIEKKVRELVKETLTSYDQVQALYEYITQSFLAIEIDPAHLDYQCRTVSEVFNSNYGHRLEQVMLFMTMLRELGAETSLLFCSPSEEFVQEIPTLRQFREIAVEVQLPGYCEWFDLQEGLSTWNKYQLQSQTILKISTNGFEFLTIDPTDADANRVIFKIKASLDDSMNLTGQLAVRLTGSFSPYYTVIEDTVETLKTKLQILGNDMTIEKINIHRLQPEQVSISCPFKTKLDSEELDGGLQLLLLPSITQEMSTFDPTLHFGERINPVRFDQPFREMWVLEITFPENIEMIHSPTDIEIIKSIGSLTQTSDFIEGILQFSREFSIISKYIEPSEYVDLKQLFDTYHDEKKKIIIFKAKK